ncbi:MAG: Golgi transport complex subunit 6 [Alectoria sarmentosa]|nr:MAG: Golgi transport complex subunit 6 [Alectoria sarmentosa]
MAGTQLYGDDLSGTLDERLIISSTPQRSNALSNKFSGVLSASYADSEIRDALHSLDENEIKNTAETRRRLKLNVQKQVIQRNGVVVQEYGNVAEQLKRIGATINSLTACCEVMRQHVTAARHENAPVLEEASTLLVQKQELETKKQLLDAFNKHFIMSEEDLLVLTGVTEAVDDTFFSILMRVKQIYVDCQVLLGTENQRLGLELMDQSSRNLNIGYQKLYRWIQKEFKTSNLESPQISSVIRRALRALAERPTLFQSCLDLFAETREHILTDAIYSALTGSSSGDNQNPVTKPIEFYAHDPLRYVGDMLAWTHSAAVSEREALESLFISDGDEISKGFKAGKQAEPWSAGDDEAFDGRKALGELVNRNLAGVARALRQRIEQILQNHEDAVLLYKIANLVIFYRVTFIKLLGPDSSMLETLSSLVQSALLQFQTVMSDNASAIQAEIAAPTPDLGIPDFLDEALTQFTTLLKTYDSSLTAASSSVADFKSIISQALNPFLATCEKMAKETNEPSAGIFITNCLIAAKTTLSAYDFVQDRVSELNDQLASLTYGLVEYQHAFFLHTSGLHPLLAALAPTEDTPGSLLKVPTLPPFQLQPLTDAGQTLDDFLPSALMDAMENLKRLGNTKLSQEITADAAERFCEDFEFVEGKLTAVDELREIALREGKEENENEEQELVPLRSLFPRTSGEIRVLLS